MAAFYLTFFSIDGKYFGTDTNNQQQIDDNTKPSARVGRKAYGSQGDSRVAEISNDISGPGFFIAASAGFRESNL
jgi:hypothetical protein